MANKLIHKRSSVITDNKPKLPQADGLEFGEIAINYADGYETISFKNTENEIVEVRTKEYFENIINENEEVISNALNDLNARIEDTKNAYTAADNTLKVYVEGLIDGLDIPTNLSELTNDVPFVTQGEFNSLYNSMESKQDVISDLATIRSNAAKGATALQSVPAEYVTEMELANKNYVTSAYVIGELSSKSDTGHTHPEYLTEHQDISHLATKAELSGYTTDSEFAALSNTVSQKANTSALSGYSTTGHSHNASSITGGTLNIGRIPTGTTSTTVSRGDHSHSQYLTEHQSLTEYAKLTDVEAMINEAIIITLNTEV